MVKKYKVKIDKEGNVTFDVINVTGSSCEQLTENLENMLGDTVQREYKESYYQEETELNQDEIYS